MARVGPEPHLAFAYPIMGSAVDLFRESLSCYQNGAFMASTLMCRTATETALYLAVSRKPLQKEHPMEIKLDLHSVSNWGQMRTKAKELGILREAHLKALEDVRERGHFVAHYGDRFDRRVRSLINFKGLRSWIDEGEAEDSLHKTTFVINQVVNWIARPRTHYM